MKCNACWRDLEGRAISTTCGHLFCTEDANKIMSNDGAFACPICDELLTESLMKPVDINPNEEWINMAMAGISPQILMKSAYRSVMFYIAQRDLEMQYKMNRVVEQFRQKYEAMQAKFCEKMEQVHTAYQKMEHEVENLTKDKQELQEKFFEKSRQKRKLDELYDQLRNEYESVKRTAIKPATNFNQRHQEPHTFSNPAVNMMENREPIQKGPRNVIWPARQKNISDSSLFDIDKPSLGNRRAGVHPPAFGGGGTSNPLRNRLISRSPLSRGLSADPGSTLRNHIISPHQKISTLSFPVHDIAVKMF